MFEPLKARIRELEMECEELKKKNRILELKLAPPQEIAPRQESIVKSGEFDMNSSPKEKIELFWSLFKGREDVYPTRWDNPRKQTSGYSPVYIKKRGEFVDKEDREYLPITDNVIEAHLSGEIIMGVYALTLEDKCHFIAADFDNMSDRVSGSGKIHWNDNTLYFLSVGSAEVEHHYVAWGILQ